MVSETLQLQPCRVSQELCLACTMTSTSFCCLPNIAFIYFGPDEASPHLMQDAQVSNYTRIRLFLSATVTRLMTYLPLLQPYISRTPRTRS